MPDLLPLFPPQGDHDAVELGTALMPKFDAAGLVVAVVQDAASAEILMVAHMNAEALKRTIETGTGWFWSRSRGKLWQKGETTGNRLEVKEIRVDCDQDAVLLKVEIGGDGVACHQGFRSCFYRTVPGGTRGAELRFDRAMPRVSPAGKAR